MIKENKLGNSLIENMVKWIVDWHLDLSELEKGCEILKTSDYDGMHPRELHPILEGCINAINDKLTTIAKHNKDNPDHLYSETATIALKNLVSFFVKLRNSIAKMLRLLNYPYQNI